MKKKLLILIFILFVLPGIIMASGIQVSPPELNFELTNSLEEIKYLQVVNPSENVQIFEIYPDGFESIFKISPRSFTLEAGASKKVGVKIIFEPNEKQSILQTKLSVLAKPLSDSQIAANAGVKIPVTLSFTKDAKQKNQINTWIIIAISGLVFFIVLFQKFILKRI